MNITERLDEIQKVIKAATPGPWWVSDATEEHFIYSKAKGASGPNLSGASYEDSWFIAQSRTTMPQLVEALKVAVEGLEHIVYGNPSVKPLTEWYSTSYEALKSLEEILCPASEGEGKMNLTSSGHGHVVQRLDGVRARCGGPSICKVCQKEKAWWDAEKKDFTDALYMDLEDAKKKEDQWFSLHGFPNYQTADETGQAHPAHRAWVEVCQSASERSPMARKMFVLGWLKGRASSEGEGEK